MGSIYYNLQENCIIVVYPNDSYTMNISLPDSEYDNILDTEVLFKLIVGDNWELIGYL